MSARPTACGTQASAQEFNAIAPPQHIAIQIINRNPVRYPNRIGPSAVSAASHSRSSPLSLTI